jgi:hypothetical protein
MGFTAAIVFDLYKLRVGLPPLVLSLIAIISTRGEPIAISLPISTIPVFPITRSIKLFIRRKQILVCPTFCLTDYKVQGQPFSKRP